MCSHYFDCCCQSLKKALSPTDHRKIFQELKDLNKFKKFKIEFDTLSWENGLDLAPEFLYDLLLNSNKIN